MESNVATFTTSTSTARGAWAALAAGATVARVRASKRGSAPGRRGGGWMARSCHRPLQSPYVYHLLPLTDYLSLITYLSIA